MKNSMSKTLSNLALTKRKVAYSLAAGAAALTTTSNQDADAAVEYSGPQNIDVLPSVDPPYPDPYRLFLDLDGDTFSDLALQNAIFGGNPYQGLSVFGNGQVAGFDAGPYNFAYVSNLTEGALIDSTTVGPTFFGSMASASANPNAEFINATDGYVGLSFGTSPNLRFGWIRVDVDSANASFTIKDWAYETEPGVSINAGQVPEPGTLGLLAAGAAGVAAMRKRRKQVA